MLQLEFSSTLVRTTQVPMYTLLAYTTSLIVCWTGTVGTTAVAPAPGRASGSTASVISVSAVDTDVGAAAT